MLVMQEGRGPSDASSSSSSNVDRAAPHSQDAVKGGSSCSGKAQAVLAARHLCHLQRVSCRGRSLWGRGSRLRDAEHEQALQAAA
jgi:hypothetical protein